MYLNVENFPINSNHLNVRHLSNDKGINVMIVGLGGLGVVSLAQKLRNLLSLRYLHVHTIEQRGVAQRRSTTSAMVKASNQFVSPSLAHTQVDILIALEPLEALRHAHLLKPNALCIVSDYRVETICGGMRNHLYPDTEDIVSILQEHESNCITMELDHWLKKEKLLPIYASTAMLGVFCSTLGFDRISLDEANLKSGKKHLADEKNEKAFVWGFQQFTPVDESAINDQNYSPIHTAA